MGRNLNVALVAVISVGAVGQAVLLGGCGASQTVDPIARAADVTARIPGYRMAATMNLTTPAGPAQLTLTGRFDRVGRTGAMTAQETIAGHRLQFVEEFSGQTFYLRAVGLSALKKLTGGKQWLKFDMSRALGAMGVGSLPTAGTDPTQFVDFLRAVSSSTKRIGAATVRGVATTHYRATVDLNRYPKLAPAADRAAAQRSVTTLESALGGHTMPMDVWIDHSNLVRRIGLSFGECVAGQHIKFAMTMDLYGYGPQPRPHLPSATETYDLTPLLSSTLSKVKFGCGSG